jgi:hypothetical protein
MKEISLDYYLNRDLTPENLEKIYELSENLKDAIELEKYGGVCTAFVDAFIPEQSQEFCYRINLRSDSSTSLKNKASVFMNRLGIPNFVSGDYNLIEDYLNQSGKTLKRKFKGSLVGKHVVDKE